MFTMLVLALFVVEFAASSLVTPPWDFPMPSKQICLQYNYTSSNMTQSNARLTWVALPEGDPPQLGWPVVFYFITDAYNASDGVYNECSSPPIPFIGHLNPTFGAFSLPGDSMRNCLPYHSAHGCYFDSMAGAVWDQRGKQYLLANGIAVIQVNPWRQDEWDYPDPYWSTGRDKPFTQTIFKKIKEGVYGPLDASRVIFTGYSGGAQMVSWMFQKAADKSIVDIRVVGGVFLSGGSYNCYSHPPASHGICANCNASSSCRTRGCSDSPPPGTQPCCNYCCPDHFAEQYYEDNPAEWANHPPAFLAQLQGEDFNADLCAARHYHSTLAEHDVPVTMVLDTVYDSEHCFCGGNPNDTAAVGSPFLGFCANHTMKCAPHAKGFAAMVQPMAAFCLEAFANASL
jgi:hypothetical protein